MSAALDAPQLTCEELLTTTRAVRRGLDLDRPVPLEVVKDCLRIALQAPNGSNRQDWRWIVLADPDRRAEVAAVYRAAFHRRFPARPDRPAPTARSVVGAGRELAEKLHRVPVLLLPCLELGERRLTADNQAGVWASLAPATWSFMLAARTRGLGTVLTTVHLDAEAEVAALLGLPPGVRQGGLLPVAYARKTRFRPGPRRPLDEVLHLDGWNGARG
ncbi:oxidoreductase [Kitasatospora phosalacinea]|uniref:Oxidoreductase n=1 Tax=Kitasatospora phosalacinea TaxID=2065 RepID=A0A9W6V0M2_9ACTN|nr:nitroreductase family protein [Kitasatospora phosalacinea]GLW68387.1 oxidoreductase [Kitasatospora phosalacinea]